MNFNKLMVTNLFIYPIKSTFRIELEESEVKPDGLKHDRTFAIINDNNRIITARENQNVFKIKTKVENDAVILTTDKQTISQLSLLETEQESKEATFFTDFLHVKTINHQINDWISKTIEESAHLVQMDEEKMRPMKLKYNAKENDIIGFKDAAPIHLITESSLNELNKSLDEPVTIHHFRPNIVIKGSDAYAEDHWKKVTIGECEFDVAVKTARCPMITVDPDLQKTAKSKEPLKTLSKLRKENNRVNFGIYLIPRKIGQIKVTDQVIVEMA